MIYVDVYIEDPFLHNEVLTYHSEQLLDAGVRVFVSVQQSTRIGFVKQSYEREELGFSTKPISGVVDDTPIINQELWELGNWMSKTTLNPIIRCFQAILPNQLRPSSSAKKKQLVTMVRVVDPQLASTPKQMEMIEAIGEGMPLSEANKISSVVTSLIKKGALERFEVERRYQPRAIEIKPSHIELTQKQQDVLSEIDLTSNKTYLLHGITGSGKTEIYLQAAASVLASGKQVLILVPEISLTPQMISRFQKRFGQDIGIYHSGLNPQEKYEQYQRVQRDEVSIVVGTRSAVFLPFKDLGLIVMDEEHDDSFKQESTPFYHARDIALKRAQNHGCPLLLGSASPSLESYARAIKGNYQLLELPSRINNSLPIIKVIDTNSQLRTLSYQPLSNELIGALKHTLENHQQSILLLNRRSYAPIMKCSQCGHVLMCPNCETTLSYHKADQSFRCHTCDHVSFRQDCPECGNRVLEMKGFGTQRLEEIVAKHLPTARLLRMDRDTTTHKNSHQKLLSDFNNHEADILIGTQMIAKGLDNPLVTCVGIISPDAALLHEDFSSAERVFSLILQASGRAGRHDLAGHVYIQTFNPDHYAIQYALRQDYKRFFMREMQYRHMGSYPPYSYLIELVFLHKSEAVLDEVVFGYQRELVKHKEFTTLGPAVLRMQRNLLRRRLILKGKDLDFMRETLYDLHAVLFKQLKGVRVSINVNPVSISS